MRAVDPWTSSERYTTIMGKEHISAKEVTDVIVECFVAAYGDEQIAHSILRKQFSDAGVDMANPTKGELVLVMNNLKRVASTFKNPDAIQSNYLKIKKLIDRCDC